MKTLLRISLCICIVFAFPLKGSNKASTGIEVLAKRTPDGIPIVNLLGTYPENEISLQDIADVEYVPLETRNDVLVAGSIAYYSKKHLVVFNQSRGDVFVFDAKTGKVISKFNHKGNGGNEYISMSGVAYDENAGKVYIADNRAASIVLVYTKEGTYINTLPLPEGVRVEKILNVDNETLLIYNRYLSGQTMDINHAQPYIFISKKDGQELSRIDIKLSKRLAKRVSVPLSGRAAFPITIAMNDNTKYGDEYIFADLSCDTVFQYTKKQGLKPLLIRTPSVWDNPRAFLGMLSGLKTDRFISLVSVAFDFEAIKSGYEKGNMPNLNFTSLMYDIRNNTVFIPKIVNADNPHAYTSYDCNGIDIQEKNTIVSFLAAEQLVTALENDQLSGKLKILAETLEEDANPVLMIIKYK